MRAIPPGAEAKSAASGSVGFGVDVRPAWLVFGKDVAVVDYLCREFQDARDLVEEAGAGDEPFPACGPGRAPAVLSGLEQAMEVALGGSGRCLAGAVDPQENGFLRQGGGPDLVPEALDDVTVAAADFHQRPAGVGLERIPQVMRQRVDVDPAVVAGLRCFGLFLGALVFLDPRGLVVCAAVKLGEVATKLVDATSSWSAIA